MEEVNVLSKSAESEIFLTQKALEDRIGSYTHTHTHTHIHTPLGNHNLLAVSDLTHAIERRN